MVRRVVCESGPAGRKGQVGPEQTWPIPIGGSGADGTLAIASLASLSKLPALPPRLWLANYIHEAELDYLNDNLESCANKLQWLAYIDSKCKQQDASYAPFVGDKLAAISANLLAGRGVFGYDSSYVPLLTVPFLQSHITSQLLLAEQAESAAANMAARAVAEVDKRNRVKKVVQNLTQSASTIEISIRDDFSNCVTLRQSIVSLRENLDASWEELNKASDTFKAAVTRRSGGCGFNELLTFAALATTIVASGGSTAAFASASMTAMTKLRSMPAQSDPSASLFSAISTDAKAISTTIKPAVDSFQQMQASLQDVKTAWKKFKKENINELPSEATLVSSDYAKIIVNKAAFDSEIANYLSMPEATAYKRQMDLFVSIAETRNNKIIEHDNFVRGIWTKWGQLRLNLGEADALAAATDFDFAAEQASSAMQSQLRDIKWELCRSLVMLCRALEYALGAPTNIQISDLNVGSVAASFVQVNQQVVHQLQTQASAKTGASLSLALVDVLTDSDLGNLSEGKSVIFSIHPDHPSFAGRYAMTVQRVSIIGPAQESGDLRATFQQEGRSVIRQRDGTMRAFTHNIVATIFSASATDNSAGDLGADNQTFVGVSPYGPWKMRASGGGASKDNLARSRLRFDVLNHVLLI